MGLLTQSRLKELLECDPDTGEFTWKVYRAWNARAGQKACYLMPVSKRHGIRIDTVLYLRSRLVWLYVHGEWPHGDLDHINGNQADDRIQNLREATRSQNTANTGLRADNTSGFKGVTFNKERQRWKAQIRRDGKHKTLGRFRTKEEAHKAYVNASLRHDGEFSKYARIA